MANWGLHRVGPKRMRWMFNLYPPFFFQRIKLSRLDPDYRLARVEVPRSWINTNLNGTTFGGTIYSGADPMFTILYWKYFQARGIRVEAWLRTAKVHFRRPARSRLTIDHVLEAEDLDAVLAELRAEGRTRRTHVVEAIDANGEVCATIETENSIKLVRDIDPGAAGEGAQADLESASC